MNILDLFITLEFKDEASSKIDLAVTKYESLASRIGTGLDKAAALGAEALKKLGKAAEEAAKFTIATGSEFEAQMSKVRGVGEFTAEEMALITEKAKEMGIETKYSATEAGVAMENMAQAGWSAQQIIDGIAGVMDLAASSGEDLASSSDIVVNALNAFGYQAEDSSKFADILAKTAADTNAKVSDLGASFKYVAPIAGTLGYTLEDVAVAVGLMADAGIKGTSAGTALRSVLSRLSSPTDQVAGAMDTLGISLTETDGTAKSLHDVISGMREAFSGLSESEQVAYASTIAAKTGMSGLLAVVNSSDEDFAVLTSALETADGSAKRMADTMQDNLKGKFEIFKSSVEGLGLVLYDYMVDPLKWLAENGTASVDALTKAITEGGLSEGMKLVAEEFGKAVSDVEGHAQALFENLSAELSDEENHQMLIDAAGSIATFLSEKFASSTDAIGRGAVEFFGNLSESLTSEQARESYKEDGYTIAKNIVTGIGNLVTTGSDLQTSVLDPLINSFKNPGETSWGDVGKSILDGIVDGFEEVAPRFIDSVKSTCNTAMSFLDTVWGKITDTAEAIWEYLEDATDKPSGNTSSQIGDVYTSDPTRDKFSDKVSQWEGGTGMNYSAEPDSRVNNERNIGGKSTTSGGVNVTQYIYSEAKTAADLMEEARYEAEKAVLFGV